MLAGFITLLAYNIHQITPEISVILLQVGEGKNRFANAAAIFILCGHNRANGRGNKCQKKRNKTGCVDVFFTHRERRFVLNASLYASNRKALFCSHLLLVWRQITFCRICSPCKGTEQESFAAASISFQGTRLYSIMKGHRLSVTAAHFAHRSKALLCAR